MGDELEEQGRVSAEVELGAIKLIVSALDSLGSDAEARSRVMRWACDRYELGELNP